MKTMHIILRTCAPVNKSSAGGARPFGLNKETLILKCLKSVLEGAINYKDRIFIDIIDDSSSEKFRKKMKTLLDKYNIKYNFQKISLRSNGKSAEVAWKTADRSKSDLLYFLEDDYLHLPNSFEEIFYTYDNKIIYSDNFAIHPTDYPDRYIKLNPSYIFLGKTHYWRSIFNTTGTFIIPRKYFKKYKKYFYKFSDFNKKSTGGEDLSFNEIWKTLPIISPMPSLATHLNEDTLPPFIDWRKEVEKIKA